MKKFWLGFFACFALVLIFGHPSTMTASYTPLTNNFTSPDNISNEFTNISNFLNHPQFTIKTSSPIPAQLREGEIVFYSSTTFNSFGVSGQFVSEFTRVNGSTFSFTWQRL